MTAIDCLVENARDHLRMAMDIFQPHHIVTMISGGRDSTACHALAVELGLPITLSVHGRTGCGIAETTEWVKRQFGSDAPLVVADAGTAYEDYVLRKGFFGKGIAAHGFAYRVLKAQPFRKAISAELRRGKRGVRVMLLNGARKDESENRKSHLRRARPDPAQTGNVWFNLIHDWTAQDRDAYLASRNVPINPVATQLCRSGECMCGKMQSDAQRLEAAALFPHWGKWLADLEAEAIARHGFGWGEPFPGKLPEPPTEIFQPMCIGCTSAPDKAIEHDRSADQRRAG